jgi:hypothetical protein
MISPRLYGVHTGQNIRSDSHMHSKFMVEKKKHNKIIYHLRVSIWRLEVPHTCRRLKDRRHCFSLFEAAAFVQPSSRAPQRRSSKFHPG